jgi:hypothetical protein
LTCNCHAINANDNQELIQMRLFIDRKNKEVIWRAAEKRSLHLFRNKYVDSWIFESRWDLKILRKKNSSTNRFCARIVSTALIEILWNQKNLNLAMHEYIRDLFDSLSNATIIFVCLCIEHAIRKFQIKRFVLIRFETDAMKNMNIVRFCFFRMMTLKLAFQIRYQRIFDMQAIRRKNIIRKILFKRIKRIIDVNNAFHIYNVTVVKDFYRIDVNDLSMNELNDDEEFDDDVEESNNEKRSNNHSNHDLNRDLNINSKSIDESRDVASFKNVKMKKFHLHRIKLLTQNDFSSRCHSSWSTITR